MNLHSTDQHESKAKQFSIAYGVMVGLISAAFFSLTFVLNSAIALDGGAWQWTAALRYFLTIVILLIVLSVYYGFESLIVILRGFMHRAVYWILAGTLSCGFFYSGIAFAADHMVGWVIAATWQITIVASVVVIFSFSRTFSIPRLVTSLIVFLGVIAVNWQGVDIENVHNIWAFIALLISAIAYPIGNQLLSIEQHKSLHSSAPIGKILQNPLVGILLLALGSLPFWAILLVLFPPDKLAPGQFTTILMTTLGAGIIATALFYYARNLTTDSRNITAVDTTQSTEVVFAMILEISFIRPAIPNILQILGILLIFVGITANCFNIERIFKR